ncbi:MAG: Slp family lipoprotein, partial [Candidatus Nitrosoglobus sp.]
MLWKISFIFTFLTLEGCASQVPLLIRGQPPENPSISAVQEDISRYQGSHVRWGGTIASIQNKKESTI